MPQYRSFSPSRSDLWRVSLPPVGWLNPAACHHLPPLSFWQTAFRMRCPRPHFPWSGIQIPSEASHRWHIGSSQGTDSTRWGQCPVGPVDSMRTWRCLILKPGRRKKAWCSVFCPDPAKAKEQLPGNCWNSRANACSSDACVILVSSVYKMEGYEVKRKRESGGKNECESVFQETTDGPDGIR